MTESRPAIFSSALLPHEIAWFKGALSFIKQADDRRARLYQKTKLLRVALEELGYNISQGTEQIIALESGTEPQTIALRDALESRGVFGAVFCAPATLSKRSLVRFTVNCNLTDRELEKVVDVCKEVYTETKAASWPSTLRKTKSKTEPLMQRVKV